MKRAGYTLIEVMTALVVMTIGAAGILAMQGATVRSNQDANESTVAANFATTWLERIKRDAHLWTAPGQSALDASGSRILLKDKIRYPDPDAPQPPAATEFFVPARWPTSGTVIESPGADYRGFDTIDDIRFCVNIALTLAHAYNPATPGALNLTADANALQAAVRVWWYRWGPDADRQAVKCLDGPLSEAQNADPLIRKQYYSTIVSWRAPGWP